MNRDCVEPIVKAVLYEGYLLYPYRPTSKKNLRERFTFGRVYPEPYSLAQNGAEPCLMQTECLVQLHAEAGAMLEISIGFLQPIAREIGALEQAVPEWRPEFEQSLAAVTELRVGGEVCHTWLEAAERQVSVPALTLSNPGRNRMEVPFEFPGWRALEPLRAGDGQIPGAMLRRQEPVKGVVEVVVEFLEPLLRRVTVRVKNTSLMPAIETAGDRDVLMRTFASTHTVLQVQRAEFVSLMDPPAERRLAAKSCQNIGTWPVLVGDEAKAERHTMLSSPIILYDYTRLAPQSAGPLFDGTEIDELLTLRIMSLTETEKKEMRATDEQARRLLERTEALPEGALLRMHGAMQPAAFPAPAPVEFDDFFGASTRLKGAPVGDVFLKAGDLVRLRPKARADAFDLMLSGQTATIEAVEQDLEGRVHLAVVLEKDPGKDLGLLRQPGHRFFFGVDEVEPIEAETTV